MTEAGGGASRQPSEALPGEGLLDLHQASAYLRLPVDAVRALVDAGFLRPARPSPDGPMLHRAELRAFMTWDLYEEVNGASALGSEGLHAHVDDGTPEALLEALENRADQMAHQALEMFGQVFPEAVEWSARDRSRFLEQAESRFRAILTVSEPGSALDDAFGEELEGVGAEAAWGGAPLPQLLIVLRISRDLLVQTAVELAGDQGGQSGLALALLLTRVLPAVDRLTDSLAHGYWSAVVGRQKEARARYEHVLEHASDGVYEVDVEGRIQYANPQLGVILGRRRLDELDGALLDDVMAPVDGGPAASVLTGLAGGTKPVEITVARPDGAPRVLRIRTVARMAGGELVGYQGVVRDITATRELEAQKERLLTALLDELRLSLVRLSDVGAGLESAAARLTPEDLRRIGAEVTDHGRRLASLAQSLSGASELAAATPALDPRPLVLLDMVTAATNATSEAGNLHVEIPEGLRVVADADSLQRVLRAMLVAAHGPAGDPVRVEVEAAAGAELTIAVSTPRPSASEPDLTLERLLVEAMGGRLWYRDEPGGRASFHLALPVPRRRQGDEVIRL